MKHFTSATHEMHKTALLPVVSGRLPNSESVADLDPERFAAFLNQQRLHACWLDLLVRQEGALNHFEQLAPHLRDYTRISSARELPQQRILRELADLFSSKQIPWFTAKGSHLRHVIYESPQLRPAVDIDIFVRETDRNRAIDVLQRNEFKTRPMAETLSHEIKLTKLNADVDLHWHLFRPGRSRPGLLEWLFTRREAFNDFQGLDDTASLLVMLVHPAITKYLLSPTSMLIHQVDQARLIARNKIKWEELETALTRSGTRTAAWSSLYVLEKLAGVKAPEGFEAQIRPARMQAGYLRSWIDNGLIAKYFDRRWLVAGLFSLALQDSLGDAARALNTLRQVRNSGHGPLLQKD